MASSNASEERTFSVLKRINNYFRCFLIDKKMSSLSDLDIDNDHLNQIDWTYITNKYATIKCKKPNKTTSFLSKIPYNFFKIIIIIQRVLILCPCIYVFF